MALVGVYFLRTFSAVALLPLGADVASVGLRLYLAILLTLCLSPGFGGAELPVSPACLAQNVIIGLALGLPISLAVQAAEWFGELFDSARGQSLGAVLDPNQIAPSIVSFGAGTAARAILIGTGFLAEFCHHLRDSVDLFPLAKPFEAPLQQLGQSGLVFLASYCTAALQGGLPFALIFLSVEVVLALAAKMLPGISLSTESFTLKLTLGFLVLGSLSEEHAALSLRALASLSIGTPPHP